ncbi:MAG: Rho termination factor N-terminal domain-containing protein [Lachnospiraceae bacterium]|nr:Rho termination factor N-terminal domain-containing protein [Lachnospiraceae bacterium]
MILKKGNVERIADNAVMIAKLKKEGFEEVKKEVAATEKLPKKAEKTKSLEALKVDELRAHAKEKRVEGYSSLTKAELVDVLKDVV